MLLLMCGHNDNIQIVCVSYSTVDVRKYTKLQKRQGSLHTTCQTLIFFLFLKNNLNLSNFRLSK